MSQAKSEWTNKKYGKQVFTGIYTRDENGERVFVLFAFDAKKDKVHHVSFESAQAAKGLGWVKS